jgi:alpha 1,2-mannosyltransferase
MTLYEFRATVPTLWSSVKGLVSSFTATFSPTNEHSTEFMQAHPQYIVPDNAMRWMSNDGGITYNYCHCMPYPFSFSLAYARFHSLEQF